MKLFSTAVLMSCVAVAASDATQGIEERRELTAEERRELDAAALHARWFMEEPQIGYNTATNTFTLEFNTSSTEMDASLGMLEEEFFDINCSDDGSGFVEYVIPDGIFAPDGVSNATFSNGPDGRPQLQFKISPQILANDDKIYTYVDETA